VSVEFDRSAPRFWVRLLSDAGEHRLYLGDRLLGFEFEDTERGADKCVLTVDNRDLAHFDDPVWKKGNRLIVSWGYPGRMAVPREVVIGKVQGSLALKIEGRSVAELMNRRRRSRTFESKTRSDVVREIATEYGWGESAQVIEETGVRLPHIHQAAMTDAQFIMRLARLEGFQFYVDAAGLHYHKRDFGAPPTRVFQWYTDPGMGEVVSFEVENDITAKPGRVRRAARDPLAKETVEGDSDTEAPERDVLTAVQELLGIGATQQVAAMTAPPGPGEPDIVIDPETRAVTLREHEIESEDAGPTADALSATREAEGLARRAQQVAVKMKLTAIGDPMLLAKSIVELRGFGKRLSVRYYVRSVKHTIAASGGYKMQLTMVSDGHGGHSTTSRTVSGLELLDGGPSQRGNRNNRAAAGDAAEAAPGQVQASLEPRISIDPESGLPVYEYVDRPAVLMSTTTEGEALMSIPD
jgi:hypothetical protein